jgi:hypothetical protein
MTEEKKSTKKKKEEVHPAHDIFQQLQDFPIKEYIVTKEGKYNKKTGKKDMLSYLPWSKAFEIIYSLYPDAEFGPKHFTEYFVIGPEVKERQVPYLKTDCGVFVETSVTIQDVTRSMQLPVLDYMQKPISSPNSFDINASVMRCLVKNFALFGLGLELYAKEAVEELNNGTLQSNAQNVPPPSTQPKKAAPKTDNREAKKAVTDEIVKTTGEKNIPYTLITALIKKKWEKATSQELNLKQLEELRDLLKDNTVEHLQAMVA